MPAIIIKGMKCQHCTGSVKKALSEIDGISNVDIDLEKGVASYKGDAPTDIVKEAINKIGFEVQ